MVFTALLLCVVAVTANKVEMSQIQGAVAFSAVYTGKTTLHVDQLVRYSDIVLNEGNAYNPITGVFTAPFAGIYLFSYFLGRDSTDEGQVWLALMHNGKEVNAGVADKFHEYQDIQGGNEAILNLRAGDVVYVKVIHTDAFLDGQSKFTTFSGVLLG